MPFPDLYYSAPDIISSGSDISYQFLRVLKGVVTMYAKVFKSLCKPVFWGGLPRDVFISILLIGIFSFVILHSIKVFIPLFFIYIFLLSIVRIDHRIFGIIKDSLRLKSHYY